MSVSLPEVRAEVGELLADADLGAPLDPWRATFVALAVHATPTVLDGDGISAAATRALDLGADAAQVHEAIVFVSGIGLHTMIEGSRRLAELLAERADPVMQGPLDERRRELLETYVGEELAPFERAVPGFFESLARISPGAFEGFFAYRSLPWAEPTLDPLTKELMAVAVDAVPSHRFLPTLRLHVARALELGAGRTELEETLEIAAAAPSHPGVR